MNDKDTTNLIEAYQQIQKESQSTDYYGYPDSHEEAEIRQKHQLHDISKRLHPDIIKQYRNEQKTLNSGMTEEEFYDRLNKSGARWVTVNGDFHCPLDQLFKALGIQSQDTAK